MYHLYFDKCLWEFEFAKLPSFYIKVKLSFTIISGYYYTNWLYYCFLTFLLQWWRVISNQTQSAYTNYIASSWTSYDDLKQVVISFLSLAKFTQVIVFWNPLWIKRYLLSGCDLEDEYGLLMFSTFWKMVSCFTETCQSV